MNFTGHSVVIVALYAVLAFMEALPVDWSIPFIGIVASAVMDLDLKLPFFKHRGVSHSFVGVGVLAFIGFLMFQGTAWEALVVYGVLLGGLSHLLIDGEVKVI